MLKTKTFTLSAIAVAVSICYSATVSANDEVLANKTAPDTVVIIGDRETAKQLAGSGNVVPPKQMSVEAITDIHQALKTVPGVYIREEEGFGLRPNIGIRAASGNRSSRITLMEDGVLMAPAPYAAPAAYYFPIATRMSYVEVLKGAPLLRYGPYTTGGAVNLVSTPIPTETGGFLSTSFGSYGSSNFHGYVGGQKDSIGWLMEAVDRNSDGFKDIDLSNRDSGFDESDFVGKLRWQSEQGPYQEVNFKVQRSTQVSDTTYLGLTERDFAADPNRRYAMSQLDQMKTDHTGLSLNYFRELSESLSVNTILYRNDFTRNWFKIGGANDFITAANEGDANAQAILRGTADVAGLGVKLNGRNFYSQGVEVNFNYDWGNHLLAVGMRSHEDETDRFQPTDIFDQINGSLVYQETVQPNASNNRVGQAEATSFWLRDTWTFNDRLELNLALRYEDVDTVQTRYDAVDRSSVEQVRRNTASEWSPGVSATYQMSDSWQFLAGVHNGFSPLGAGATANEKPETSTNWEFGTRFQGNNLFMETILFISDFSEKEELCTVGTPCSNGATSGRFTTGEAQVAGVEFQLSTSLNSEDFSIPVDFAYTYTQAEISADNATSGVSNGDQLKDIPESVYSLRVGYETNGDWSHYATVKFIDETCAVVGCNRSADPTLKTDSLTVFDLVSRYRLTSDLELFFKAENIFDEQVVISRVPEGPRPNKPLTLWLGFDVSL